jgi:uncharacterized membrane protein
MYTGQQIEIMLSVAIIIIAVLAILYFIYFGAGMLFYLLFLFAVIAMVLMWRTVGVGSTKAAASQPTVPQATKPIWKRGPAKKPVSRRNK